MGELLRRALPQHRASPSGFDFRAASIGLLTGCDLFFFTVAVSQSAGATHSWNPGLVCCSDCSEDGGLAWGFKQVSNFNPEHPPGFGCLICSPASLHLV